MLKMNNKSFTFLELIISIGVIAIGIFALVSLSAGGFKSTSLQKNKLIAMNLASEEAELIRNVRDENWIYKGLSDCNKDSNTATCSNGQVDEDGNDCDWRCGNEEKNSPSYQPTFILDNHLQDLDYLGHGAYNSSIDYTTKTCKNDGAFLKIDSNGFYQHTSGTNSIFKRLVSISRTADTDGDSNGNQNNNDLQVKVTVCWQESGSWQEVSLEDHLYNSREE